MNSVLRWTFLALSAFACAFAQAQGYPSKPIRVIIPFPPGGGSDAAARLVTNHLAQVLAQTFVIDARPGGNTVIGTMAVAKAPADGYTLLFTGGSTMSIQPFMFAGKPPFDPLGDFAPVGMVSRFPFFLVVPASLQANSLQELIALAKASPGKLSYASNGSGTIGHLSMEMIRKETGIDLIHVPYKGFAPAVIDLLPGRVTMLLADVAPIGQHVRAGNLKVLAATSAKRSSYWPEVPTVAEQGIPGFGVEVWFALYAPAKTPDEIVARLNAEMQKYLSSPEAKDAYAKIGMDSAASSAEELRARIIAEQNVFSKAVKDANLKVE
ncbi:MAG: tripartite tricarboxylate transporter substrate binding protein [Betaproteobacteria bacterium]|nr:tripartite tricarboxylate transporter substrate binding protein [Betaproteobacteria bacterium]